MFRQCYIYFHYNHVLKTDFEWKTSIWEVLLFSVNKTLLKNTKCEIFQTKNDENIQNWKCGSFRAFT